MGAGGVDSIVMSKEDYPNWNRWNYTFRSTIALYFLSSILVAAPSALLRLTMLRRKSYFSILLALASCLSLALSIIFAADYHIGLWSN